MTIDVVFYHSGIAGAPGTTVAVAGGLTAILDACLVNGFNSVGVSSITRSGSTVTLTTSTGNNFGIGQVVEVQGADQAGYNARHRVTGKTGNQITFEIVGTPVTPATGTITARHPPAGWTKTLTATNRGAYRSKMPGTLGHYMQVEDDNPYSDGGLNARTRLAAALTDWNVADSLGEVTPIFKSSGTWVLAADPRACYLWMGGGDCFMFGEGLPYRADDEYMVWQNRGENVSSLGIPNFGNFWTLGRHWPCASNDDADGRFYMHSFLRSFSQIGSWCVGSNVILAFSGGQQGNSSTRYLSTDRWTRMTLPSAVDGSIPMQPLILSEFTSGAYTLRGEARGLYLPAGLSSLGWVNNHEILDPVIVNGSPRTLALVRYGANRSGQIAVDLDSWDD